MSKIILAQINYLIEIFSNYGASLHKKERNMYAEEICPYHCFKNRRQTCQTLCITRLMTYEIWLLGRF